MLEKNQFIWSKNSQSRILGLKVVLHTSDTRAPLVGKFERHSTKSIEPLYSYQHPMADSSRKQFCIPIGFSHGKRADSFSFRNRHLRGPIFVLFSGRAFESIGKRWSLRIGRSGKHGIYFRSEAEQIDFWIEISISIYLIDHDKQPKYLGWSGIGRYKLIAFWRYHFDEKLYIIDFWTKNMRSDFENLFVEF